MQSVRFCTDSDLDVYKKHVLLTSYIEQKCLDINSDADSCVERRLTNLGVFRAYIEAYLRNNNLLHQTDKTFLVRQLPPTAEGVGLEVYVFTKTTNWLAYESIQADIFDHLIAMVSYFDLKIFQNPTGITLLSS